MPTLGKIIKHATNQMNQSMDQYAKQFGLTGTQMSIIDFIGTHKRVLQRDIEREFNIQRSTATVALQRMERAALIHRQPAARDARQKEVTLTAKALRLEQHVANYIAQQQATIDAEFTPAEQRLIVRMLDRFIQINGGDQHNGR